MSGFWPDDNAVETVEAARTDLFARDMTNNLGC